jgi:predicted Zn-dependent protease
MASSSPTPSLAVLQTAAGLLQAGRHAQARPMLQALVQSHPGTVQAHRLLAGSFFQTDEHALALQAVQAWLGLQPDNVEAHVLRARVLVAAGQPAEAERALRQVLVLAPDNLVAASMLARLLLGANRVMEVGSLLEPLFRNGRANPEILMLYGHSLMSLGESAQAERVFRRWLELKPNDGDARLRLAAVLADTERYDEAAREARAGIAKVGKTPEAAFVLARTFLGQSRFDEAEAELRQLVRAWPGHVLAQTNLAELLWMRSGDAGVACVELDAALQRQPQLHALRVSKARLLLSARRAHEALAVIDAGLVLADRDPELLRTASTIALEFDGQRALDYAQRLLAVAPNDYGARVAFGNACLAVGRAQAALDAANTLHRAKPTDGQALAMQADALRMLGDPRYRELLDYQGLVQPALLDVPDGWPDLGAYLDDLVADLTRSHTLRAHPVINSLRGGTQVQLVPQASACASIRAFPQAIDGPIRRYMEVIGHGADPMRCRNTGRYRISGMWSVRLRPHGFHVNHYHQDGWISSACYLHLPPALAERPGEGWIQFGESAFPTRPPLEPEYVVKPEPGLLVLFPSYMWHGTVPFSGGPEDSRLTIAFDVVPVAAD